jgi:archaellum component FlaG (FlaF/FlaG flagellin family)
MKTTLVWLLVAASIGVAAGAALGYWEAKPWTVKATATAAKQISAKPDAKAPSVAAKASIDETTFKFDKMESGTTQQHTFEIKNTGNSPLDLEFVSHTCKCTTVELNGNPVEPGASASVKPGESAKVLLEWAAKVPAGPFRHGASFTTNDPERSRLELMVEGDIVESTTLEPSLLNFGTVNIGAEGKAEMLVMAFLEPEVTIESFEISDEKLAEQVEVKIEPVEKSALPPNALAAAKVVATLKPKGTIGPFGGSLKMKTNLKQAPSIEVPIYGAVKGDISIAGAGWVEATGTLRIAPTKSAEGSSTRLNILVRGEHAKATELKVASVTPEELKVTLGEPKVIRDNFVQIPLSVDIPPGARPIVMMGEDQGGEGEIILSTTHPQTPDVRLKAAFVVKP